MKKEKIYFVDSLIEELEQSEYGVIGEETLEEIKKKSLVEFEDVENGSNEPD